MILPDVMFTKGFFVPDNEIDPRLGRIESRLASFLANNPLAKLSIEPTSEEVLVLSPWGDDSVAIQCSDDNLILIETLNNVHLPERYSAIWHRDTGLFEIAWTAFALPERFKDLATRKFTFTHNGISYNCRFDNSTDRYLHIAEKFTPYGATNSSDYRNLFAFQVYFEHKKMNDKPDEEPEFLKDAYPISFFIDRVDWDEDTILSLVNHLNFYMTYFDTQTPIVNVHSPRSENIARQPQKRLAYGNFPKAITTRPLDDNLLHFWQASRVGDPARRFLYNYQIIEYAAFSVMEEGISKSLKRLLMAPDIIANLETVIPQIVEAMGETKLHDSQKVEHLFDRTVKSESIWNEIAENLDFFCVKTEFEGGHVAPAIANKKWTADDFATNWPGPFARAMRGIRNALSHGREQRMTAVIAPTAANFGKLQAWVPLIDVAAREVIVYRGVA